MRSEHVGKDKADSKRFAANLRRLLRERRMTQMQLSTIVGTSPSATCLWLKGLPPLMATDVVEPNPRIYYASGKSDPDWRAETRGLKGFERSKARSKTFPGIARAMADQWGRESFE